MSGQGTASQNQSSRQSTASQTSSQNQSARQSTATQAQSSRQAYGSEAREDWQDSSDDYYRRGAPYYGAAVVGTAVVAGTVAAATGYAAGAAAATTYSALPCTPTTAVVGGVTYYNCSSSWYTRAYSGSQVTYVAVPPPSGN
jgi:hypothetical protein